MTASNEYPRMVYHDDGEMQIVHSEKEEGDLGSGWGRSPNEASTAPQAASPRRVDPSGNEPLVNLLIERMKESFPMLSEEPAPEKRGPGRPPKSA